MRKLTLILFGLLFTSDFLQAQEAPVNTAVITFTEQYHNFESVTRGEVMEYTFHYVNEGDRPLVLSNVLTSCGCTASDWSTEPLLPGGSGSIKVIFDSTGKQGQQRKIITVLSNAHLNRIELVIEAFVLPSRSKF